MRDAYRLEGGEQSDGAAVPEPFRVEARPDSTRVVVEPHGELDLDSVAHLQTSVDEYVQRGFQAIVIDLRQTTFLDSSGLHLLIAQSRRTDVRVTLIDGPQHVSRLFDLTGVRDALPFDPDGSG